MGSEYNLVSNTKRIVIAILVCTLFIWFFWPGSWFRSRRPEEEEKAIACKNEALQPFQSKLAEFNAAVYDCFDGVCSTKQYIPFIGNGHLGLSPFLQSTTPEIRTKYGPSLRGRVSVDPVVRFELEDGTPSVDVYVTDYETGIVTHIQSWHMHGVCVSVLNEFYFHRKYPSLLVQETWIKNPSESLTVFVLHRSDPDWKEQTTVRIPTVSDGEEYSLLSTVIPVPNEKLQEVFIIAVPSLTQTSKISVPPYKNRHSRLLTGIFVSHPVVIDAPHEPTRNAVEKELIKVLTFAKHMPVPQLRHEHCQIWKRLTSTGLNISFSKAPNVLNGDLVNATIYYVLSNTPAPLHESGSGLSESLLKAARTSLTTPGQCYASHNTMLYPSKLWSEQFDTVDEVVNIAGMWKLTLEKRGCGHFFDAGADGMIQAITLSLGGFKFSNHHLEYNTHPTDLHRDYVFRGLQFNELMRINISVVIDRDNMAVMFASANKDPDAKTLLGHLDDATGGKSLLVHPTKLFACDAGCLDEPLILEHGSTKIPVKLTDPVTPILYITADKNHLVELKDTIHVKEVNLAPAAQHEVILLHKHGHRLGGLPALFWVILAFLVTAFHLFLFKLVYNEYFGTTAYKYRDNTGRYSI